jgi:GNAT superfamily N-acetyltransferase
MTVRAAERRDFPLVTALLEELGRATVTDATGDECRAIFERHLDDPMAAHLVADEGDGRVVGFCSLHFRERLNFATPDAWVPDLIVTAAARRVGAGWALLSEARARLLAAHAGVGPPPHRRPPALPGVRDGGRRKDVQEAAWLKAVLARGDCRCTEAPVTP